MEVLAAGRRPTRTATSLEPRHNIRNLILASPHFNMMEHDAPPALPAGLQIAKQCWLVVGTAPELSVSDKALETLLSHLCSSVVIETCREFGLHPAHRHWPRVALAVLSGTCGDRWAPNEFIHGGPALPLLVLGAAAAWPALGLSGAPAWVEGTATVRLINATHEVAAEHRRGLLPLYARGEVPMLVGAPCADGVSVASLPAELSPPWGRTDPRSVISVFEHSCALCGGAHAPARRITAGIHSAASLSQHATRMLAASILWLSNASSPTRHDVLTRLDDWAAHVDASLESTRGIEEYAWAREVLSRLDRPDSERAAGSALPFHALGCHPDAAQAAVSCSASAGAANATVLVHTFGGYRHFWPLFAEHFSARWNHAATCWPVVFASDQEGEGEEPSAEVDRLRACGIASASSAPTGSGAFSTRLHRALRALATPLVLYLQEDVWLSDPNESMGPPSPESTDAALGNLSPSLLRCASELLLDGRLDGVRFEPRAAVLAGWYYLEDTEWTCNGHTVHRLPARNRWLYSHQPGLWVAERLLAGGADAVMQPDENPWLNELLGSRRAAARDLAVGLIVVDWFVAVSSGGKLNGAGEAMVVSAAARGQTRRIG